MGLANWLTVLRILLVPVFVTLLVYRRPGAAVAVFAIAALTDLLDGWVARHHGLQSRLGAFLDPLADKILLTASFADTENVQSPKSRSCTCRRANARASARESTEGHTSAAPAASRRS